ncbi:related to SKN7-transcription factor [Sporisorium reilianum SRZ2]|uniref:Related to SKN7-transcription factor n=1 Tax=Sporisorium reilianum (strain SRZ2) TaxID=999809 RepID=E7A2P5_SPORE|nr:related to SKN7-transcription factor [Sporisorium reilianum SRZ2]
MSNHPNWHDPQPQYPGPPQQRHHSNMVPYPGPSPSSQQPPPYSNAPHQGNYPQAHLPPPVGRHPSQQQWSSSSASQDFGGPSPSNSNSRSSGPYPSGFDMPPSNMANSNSPMRQHGNHNSPYASNYPPPPSHGASDPQMHPGQRPGAPPQYDYPPSHAPPGAGYPHPQQQQQPLAPPSQHHSHPSQQQHWNNAPGHLPSVLQPQPLPPPSGPAAIRAPPSAGPPAHALDRPFGAAFPKQEDDLDDDDDYDAKGKGRAADGSQTANKGTSDFVKKLFSMLDDKAYESVVAWSPSGESFIVKDMNDFTKHVLPRNFRHSNFASFVRQLNKYDFHKVKNPGDGSGAVGEHVWEFQHPDFVRGREDLLENVKRKIPAKKKPNLKGGGALEADRDDSPSAPLPTVDVQDRPGESYADLKAQVAHLTAVQDQMQNHVLALTKQYQGVIGEMLTFQRNMVQQDQLMQNLIQYLMNLEQDRRVDAAGMEQPSASAFLSQAGAGAGGNHGASNDGPFLPPGVQGSYGMARMDEMSHRSAVDSSSSSSSSNHNNSLKAAVTAGPHSVGSTRPSADNGSSATNAGSSTRMSGMTTAPSTVAPLSPKSVASPLDGNAGKTPEMSQTLSNPLAPKLMQPPHLDDTGRRNSSLSSLRMFQHGGSASDAAHASNGSGAAASSSSSSMPKLESRNTSYDSGRGRDTPSQSAELNRNSSIPGSADGASATNNGSNSSSSGGSKGWNSKLLRPRRPTLVPGWAVPPRVLLVDDDEVCRRLSSKFLQVFGCSIDYASDGMTAVNKMNHEKYDLVLMDIIMPNLDGMSATSLIRQFDPSTPIISMTSNSGPSELINYMSSGMTDILPKPFTKEGLLNMLEKHLLHLKAAQREHRAASTDQGGPGGVGHMAAPSGSGSGGAAGGGGGGMKGGVSPVPPNHVGAGGTPSNAGTGAENDGVNPLAGMGFTDEEYVAMLQNLIAAGTGDDELASALFGNDALASNANTPSRAELANARTSPYAASSTPGTAGAGAGVGMKRSMSNTDDAVAVHGVRALQGVGEPSKRGRFGEI